MARSHRFGQLHGSAFWSSSFRPSSAPSGRRTAHQPQVRRHGPGVVHHPGDRASARRRRHRGQHTRPGQHVPALPAGRAAGLPGVRPRRTASGAHPRRGALGDPRRLPRPSRGHRCGWAAAAPAAGGGGAAPRPADPGRRERRRGHGARPGGRHVGGPGRQRHRRRGARGRGRVGRRALPLRRPGTGHARRGGLPLPRGSARRLRADGRAGARAQRAPRGPRPGGEPAVPCGGHVPSRGVRTP